MSDDWSARLVAAEATLTSVLSLAPNHAWAHLILGVVQLYTRRAAEGIAECEHALTLDRNLAVAHAYIGLAKIGLARGAETEAHINEAFRLSPRDPWLIDGWHGSAMPRRSSVPLPMRSSGSAGASTHSIAHFTLAATLAMLGELDQARAAVKAGLALDPRFTIRRFRDVTSAWGENPTFLAGCERAIEGMRMAGVPEG